MISGKTISDLRAARNTPECTSLAETHQALDEVLAFFTWKCPGCGGPLQLQWLERAKQQAAFCASCKRLYDAQRCLDPEHTARRDGKTMQESVEDALRERIQMLLTYIAGARGYLDQGTCTTEQATFKARQADGILADAQTRAAEPLPMLWRRVDPDLATRVKQLEADVRVLADAAIWCANRDEGKITKEVRDHVVELSTECPLPHHD